MSRRASRPERLDDDQAPATAGTREGEDTRPVRGAGKEKTMKLRRLINQKRAA